MMGLTFGQDDSSRKTEPAEQAAEKVDQQTIGIIFTPATIFFPSRNQGELFPTCFRKTPPFGHGSEEGGCAFGGAVAAA
jgi:hypothetical protein